MRSDERSFAFFLLRSFRDGVSSASDEREPRLQFRAILQYSHLVVSSMSDNQTSCVVSADKHISYRCGSDKLVDFTGKQIL